MSDMENDTTGALDEDDILITAFCGGQRAAFDTLVTRHQNSVFNLCYRFMGDYEEANDLAQEVFIRVYRSVSKFRFQSSFSTWLYRIAVNCCKNRLKSLDYRIKRRIITIDHRGEQETHNPSTEIGDESRSPDRELEKKERWALIQEAINSLPPEQKMVVVLRDTEGLSYSEIAGITGFRPGTVKSKLARARQNLREKLVRVI